MSETAAEPHVRELELPDWRLLERVIGLTNRLGCALESVDARPRAGHYLATIAFSGPRDALRRLDLQIARLLDDDKEMSR